MVSGGSGKGAFAESDGAVEGGTRSGLNMRRSGRAQGNSAEGDPEQKRTGRAEGPGGGTRGPPQS